MSYFRTRCALLAFALLAGQGMARADPIRICISDIPYPPFMFPDHEGSIQWLMRHAAERAGMQVDMVPMPIKRCLAEIAAGKMVARVAAHNPTTQATLRFPAKGRALDTDRSLGTAREMAFRLKGSKVEWDGHGFSNLTGAILMQPGFPTTEQLLRLHHVQIDAGGKSLEVNLGKLLAGRGEVAIGFEMSAPGILAKSEFAGKFDMLPLSVHEATYFLAFSPEYYQEHSGEIERLWTTAAEIRHTPAFEAYKQSITGAGSDFSR